jgi:hypothetical protein
MPYSATCHRSCRTGARTDNPSGVTPRAPSGSRTEPASPPGRSGRGHRPQS